MFNKWDGSHFLSPIPERRKRKKLRQDRGRRRCCGLACTLAVEADRPVQLLVEGWCFFRTMGSAVSSIRLSEGEGTVAKHDGVDIGPAVDDEIEEERRSERCSSERACANVNQAQPKKIRKKGFGVVKTVLSAAKSRVSRSKENGNARPDAQGNQDDKVKECEREVLHVEDFQVQQEEEEQGTTGKQGTSEQAQANGNNDKASLKSRRKGFVGVDLGLPVTSSGGGGLNEESLQSPCLPPTSPASPAMGKVGEFNLHSPEFFSPGSPMEYEGPRYKGFSLLPVGGTVAGESGYYATRLQAPKWQYWSFDFLNGWALVSENLSPRQCKERPPDVIRKALDQKSPSKDCKTPESLELRPFGAQASMMVDDYQDLLEELGPYSTPLDVGKALFDLIPMYRSGDQDLDLLVERKLRDKGLDPDAKDADGNSLLIRAVECNKPLLVQKLLRKGASPRVANYLGFAPLHYAVYDSAANFHSAKALLESGAPCDVTDNSGCTPLHYAACEGRLAIVALLLYHKARVDVFDCNGYTPLRYAEENGCTKCGDLLRSATNTGESEWVACQDDDTNFTYYYNSKTGDTTWEVPEGSVARTKSPEDERELQRKIQEAMNDLEMQERRVTPLGSTGGVDGGGGGGVKTAAMDVIARAESLFKENSGTLGDEGYIDNGMGSGAGDTAEAARAEEMSQMVENLLRENEDLKKKMSKQRAKRKRSRRSGEGKKTGKSTLAVTCRLRPPTQESEKRALQSSSQHSLSFQKKGRSCAKDIHCFERVLGTDVDQESVFQQAILPFVEPLGTEEAASSISSACIAFCGAHESGKTYSILGEDEHPGILFYLGRFLAEKVGTVSVSQIELGDGGACLDLLAGSRQVKSSWQENEFQSDAVERTAHSSEDFLEIVRRGFQQREVFSNYVSSQGMESHLVTKIGFAEKSLLLVELGSIGSNRQESYVNTSVESLGKILKSLKKKDSQAAENALEQKVHDSLLLQILAPSLKDGGKTMLFATLCAGESSVKSIEKTLLYCKHFRLD